MKNIHVLPTDKLSRLGYLTKKGKEVYKDLRLFDRLMPNILDSENQNIYITNSEEIKDCWVLNTNTNEVYFLKGYYGLQPISKKIILTTDVDLIKDGVQSIDDDFLEWFVKNPSCEEVKIDHERVLWEEGSITHYSYKIIIPKEEPVDFLGRTEFDLLKQEAIEEEIQEYFKQETLEKAAEKYSLELLEAKTIQPHEKTWIKSIFIHIVQWQAKRMYSEEDMAESFLACWKANMPEGFECKLSFNEWFNEFKKK